MDTNRQYSERIFSSVERIVIDTSALMDDGFLAFIQNDREILCDGQKKIVVPVEVYAELTRHLLSNDNKKCSEAQRAVEIIKQNRDIFDVEAKRLTDEDLSYAFADRQILSELTLHKSDYNQLLISNDKGLTSDAFDLNQLKSYKGGRVFVCHINCNGEMHQCECVRSEQNKYNRLEENTSSTPEPHEQPQITESACEALPVSTDKTLPWKFDWKSGAIGVCGTIVLGAAANFGFKLVRHIKL